MKKLAILFAYCIPLIAIAQGSGVKWTNGLSWSEVLKKAREENRYIFLDLFTTWCQPCHAMDKDVYPNEKVGQAINEKFIAVKVQMDKTQYDDEQIKKWYNDANRLAANYSVTAFPTYLFFSPDGKPIHRGVGYKKPEEFIVLANDALNPEKQYYALLQNYQPGKFDTSELKGLARALRSLGGELAPSMAVEFLTRIPKSQLSRIDNIYLMTEFKSSPKMQQLARTYLTSVPRTLFNNKENRTLISSFAFIPSIQDLVLGYLEKLDNNALRKQMELLYSFRKEAKAKQIADKYLTALKFESLFAKDNIGLLYEFARSSKDRGFAICYRYPDRVDKALKFKGAAKSKVINTIIDEEYNSFYTKAIDSAIDNVPWELIKNQVAKKYTKSYAEITDLHVKTSLYQYLAEKKDRNWTEYINYYIEEKERFGWDTAGPMHKFIEANDINNFVYDAIFYHSNDAKQIETGLRWMEGVIRRNPTDANNIDTYANLLYKSGHTEDAIKWEAFALDTAIREKQDWCISAIKDNLSKMKQGIPTWDKPQ
jgi:thioredoxin-related protein